MSAVISIVYPTWSVFRLYPADLTRILSCAFLTYEKIGAYSKSGDLTYSKSYLRGCTTFPALPCAGDSLELHDMSHTFDGKYLSP